MKWIPPVAVLLVVASCARPDAFAPPREGVFLDTAWYRQTQVATADLWNGGLDGWSGLGAYRTRATREATGR